MQELKRQKIAYKNLSRHTRSGKQIRSALSTHRRPVSGANLQVLVHHAKKKVEILRPAVVVISHGVAVVVSAKAVGVD